MNDTVKLDLRPDVTEFVAAVRRHLSDLSEEEREELIGGLEADLSELVADRGPEVGADVLGDPRAYADELRSAAGFTPESKPRLRLPKAPTRERLDALLDSCGDRWAALMGRTEVSTMGWDLAKALRPAWWVLRAWVAIELVDIFTGPWEYATPIPTLGMGPVGWTVLIAAVVVSVQLGRGAFWPASTLRTSVLSRTVLLGLNGFAIVMTPVVLGQFPSSGAYNDGCCYQPYIPPGLTINGNLVRNVFPYDADGNPLVGVQLFDQKGRPLNLTQDAYDTAEGSMLPHAWQNGSQTLSNVVPRPLRKGEATSETPLALPAPPMAAVPPVTLPGVTDVEEPETPVEPPAKHDKKGADNNDANKKGAAKKKQQPQP